MKGKRNAAPRPDIVYLHGLRVETLIGVHEWERLVRQTLVIDLDMACDTRPAAASDRLSDALDYARVAQRVTEILRDNRKQLLESVAHEMAETLMREFSLSWLRLRVAKPGAIAHCDDVGVLIERGERQ